MENKNFTTTLPAMTLDWLSAVSSELNVPRNNIINDALKMWKRAYNQKMIEESYRNAINDKEMKELVNMGVDEWEDNLKRWENS